jgi:hypothetical protein
MRAADRVSVKDLEQAASRLIELAKYDETDESAVALRKVGRLLQEEATRRAARKKERKQSVT